MNVCIAYFTKFGNNKKCAEYIEQKMNEKGHVVHVMSITDVKPDALPEADLYIFGSPTRMANPPGKVKRYLKRLKLATEGARFVILNTYADEATTVSEKLADILTTKGMQKAAEAVKLKVKGMSGPLEEDYTQKIDTFVNSIDA